MVTLHASSRPWATASLIGKALALAVRDALLRSSKHNFHRCLHAEAVHFRCQHRWQGTVDKNPNQETYTYNQVVTLTATAADGWSFAGWEGYCTGNGDCQVTIDDNKAVTAIFTEDQYTLDITTVGNGSVDPRQGGTVYVWHRG